MTMRADCISYENIEHLFWVSKQKLSLSEKRDITHPLS